MGMNSIEAANLLRSLIPHGSIDLIKIQDDMDEDGTLLGLALGSPLVTRAGVSFEAADVFRAIGFTALREQARVYVFVPRIFATILPTIEQAILDSGLGREQMEFPSADTAEEVTVQIRFPLD